MSCCQCQGIESFFNKKVALKELKRYHAQGPNKTTRLLVEALKSAGVDGLTLLDIGGGIGAIQHELMDAGVSRVTSVDASSGYIEVAQGEAEQRGLAERVDYQYGDFVSLAPAISPAHIVTLDRVICCYHDMESLVGFSSAKAQIYYALVYPRDTGWFKLGVPVLNFLFWLMRNPFRIFVHAPREVDALVGSNGFKPRFTSRTLLWQVVVYGR